MATVVCWGLGGVTLAHSVWEGQLQPTVCLYITHSVSVCYIRICCQRKLFIVSSGCFVFERLLTLSLATTATPGMTWTGNPSAISLQTSHV